MPTTGVASIASKALTSIRSPLRATMRARCRLMGFGRLGEQVLNTPVSGWLIARPQVLGALRDVLIEADPRPGRSVALLWRIVRDPQGRLHPPDRHKAVARLHNTSLLVGWGPRGCPDRSICTRPCWGGGLAEAEQWVTQGRGMRPRSPAR